MALSKQQKTRRNRLFAEDPHCYWCGRELVKPPGPSVGGGKCPDNAATLDHLISRLDPRRTEPQPRNAPPRTVLSCYACNELRGFAETAIRQRILALQSSQQQPSED